ncbi:MAG: hypothetical protein K2J79_01800, partial [Ruminiclostridium sp.]|nr:hypothetical protein [Ruminiclostridium sp.]
MSGTVAFNGKNPKVIKTTIQDKTGDPVALKGGECFRVEYAADQDLVSKLGVAVLAGNKNKNTENGWVDKEPYNTLPFKPVDGMCTKTVTLANVGAEGSFEISLANYQESGYETIELQVTPNSDNFAADDEFSAQIKLKVILIADESYGGETTTEPEITEPEATEPEETQPEVTKPEETQPEVTNPEDAQK